MTEGRTSEDVKKVLVSDHSFHLSFLSLTIHVFKTCLLMNRSHCYERVHCSFVFTLTGENCSELINIIRYYCCLHPFHKDLVLVTKEVKGVCFQAVTSTAKTCHKALGWPLRLVQLFAAGLGSSHGGLILLQSGHCWTSPIKCCWLRVTITHGLHNFWITSVAEVV